MACLNQRSRTLSAVETERLSLRAPGSADLDGYRTLLLDPLVQRWLRPPPLAADDPASVERLLDDDRRHWEQHGFGPAALIDRRNGPFVGRGGLNWTTVAGERAVELPWALVSQRWGEGLATEAARGALAWARELGLPEVVSFTLTSNTASRRVMEKIGLRHEGEIEHSGLPHVLFRGAP